MIEIPVELGARRYAVSIGHDLADSLPELLSPWRRRPVAFVSSPRIWSRHGARVAGSLREVGPVGHVLIPEGEANKSEATLFRVYDEFVKLGLPRDGLVVAFGGGVVGDLAGFAAATYMRGVGLIQLPTTLLSMVDSAIGGKVGINHPKIKNLVGAFHQPLAVIVDPSFLETLSDRELRSGQYEILKCAIIGDQDLFRALASLSPDPRRWSRVELEGAIASACRLKAQVVEKDEREGGLRRILNFGHTLGHALETATRYTRFAHGEAVGWGILGAALLAKTRGLIPTSAYEAITSAVERLGHRPKISDISPERILAAVFKDKKKTEGRVPFILPTGIGSVSEHRDVSRDEIRAALLELGSFEVRQLPRGASRLPSGRGAGSRPGQKPRTAAHR